MRRLLLVAALVLSGCAAHNQSSSLQSKSLQSSAVPASQHVGHPQVLIPGASRKAVADAIVDRLAQRGWTVTKTNEYGVEVEQPAKGGMGFLGSLSTNGYVTDPVYRMTFNVFDSDGGVRATGAYALIQNPHTSKESPIRLDWKKHEEGVWSLLEAVRLQLGRTPIPTESEVAHH